MLRVSYYCCWSILLAIIFHTPSSCCLRLKKSYRPWKFKKLLFSYMSLYFCILCLCNFFTLTFENLGLMLLISWLYQVLLLIHSSWQFGGRYVTSKKRSFWACPILFYTFEPFWLWCFWIVKNLKFGCHLP